MNKFFLIGMMGSGKTSVGLKLSQIIKYSYIDIDSIIDSSNYIIKKSIDSFRVKEEIEFSKINRSKDNIVVSIGGGAILSSYNKKIIKKYHCIYLNTSLDILINRVSNDGEFRPLIQAKKNDCININIFKNLYNEREAIYSKLADYIVCTNDKNIEEVSTNIKNYLIKNEFIN